MSYVPSLFLILSAAPICRLEASAKKSSLDSRITIKQSVRSNSRRIGD